MKNYAQVKIFPLNVIYPLPFPLSKGDYVVVKTEYGLHLGQISLVNENLSPKSNGVFSGEIVRLANANDLADSAQGNSLAQEALAHLKNEVKDMNLAMSIVATRYSLDQKVLIIFFSADQMIDFRALLHRISPLYRVKLRLENIGDSREAASAIDGFGLCGLSQCCNKGIKNFNVINKNAIKNQHLAPNPINHLGNCTKLKCCLMFEDELYKELNLALPQKGELVLFQNQKYKVTKKNLLLQKVTLESLDKDNSVSIEVSSKDVIRSV